MKKVLFIVLLTVFLLGCSSNQYSSDINDVTDDILESAIKVEGILDQYVVVWDESITNRGAIPIDRMVEITGIDEVAVRKHFEINNANNIPNDFSRNIHSLNSYFQETGELEDIEKRSEEIKSKVTELKNPPKEYKEAYDEILDMYNYSAEFSEMALNPDGSLQSFKEQKSKLSNDISNKYKRIEVIVPSEE